MPEHDDLPRTAEAPSRGSDAPTRKEPARSEAAAEPAVPTKRRRAKQPAVRENAGLVPNNVKRLRQAAMMSKAELARRAGVSPLTIDRVEAGCPCRMDTKRKILEALGLQPSAAKEVFPDEDLG